MYKKIIKSTFDAYDMFNLAMVILGAFGVSVGWATVATSLPVSIPILILQTAWKYRKDIARFVERIRRRMR